MDYPRIYVRRNTMFAATMPYSEVCMHMRIAGKKMACALVGSRPMVQLFDLQTGSPFSAPILTGEAGVFEDSDGYYIVPLEVV
jgi:hypothetical protein